MIENETGYTRATQASIEFDAATAAVTDDIQPKKHSMTHPAIKEAIELLNKLGYTLAAYALERMSQPIIAPNWVMLTDEDRNRAMCSMPDMLDGFLKTWGWLHFAKAIEAECRAKNGGAE